MGALPGVQVFPGWSIADMRMGLMSLEMLVQQSPGDPFNGAPVCLPRLQYLPSKVVLDFYTQ